VQISQDCSCCKYRWMTDNKVFIEVEDTYSILAATRLSAVRAY
jgi:hypothetical protein